MLFCAASPYGVELSVEAPFFGDPAPPGGKEGQAYDKLWEYEVKGGRADCSRNSNSNSITNNGNRNE